MTTTKRTGQTLKTVQAEQLLQEYVVVHKGAESRKKQKADLQLETNKQLLSLHPRIKLIIICHRTHLMLPLRSFHLNAAMFLLLLTRVLVMAWPQGS
jgi:hypothetical protein